MNTKSILTIAVVLILIMLAVRFVNRHDSPRHDVNHAANDVDRNLDKAGSDIKEGLRDAKRSVQDAVD